MSGFNADWLRLRAPFDAAARNSELAARFGAALVSDGAAPLRLVDLAAGTGANFIALAPLIGRSQDWLLADSDAVLIAAQRQELARWSQRAGWRSRELGADTQIETENGTWRARTQRIDLAQSLEEVDFAGASGVTTSAFLDLVSAVWLDRLCALLARHARPFLAALTVDGRREWHPSLPEDRCIHAAFARHQYSDKGFGPALGDRAATYLAESLTGLGYEVSTAESNWRIDARDPAMLHALARESATVAHEMNPGGAALSAEWLRERHAQIRAGALTLEVGHVDLLALPA